MPSPKSGSMPGLVEPPESKKPDAADSADPGEVEKAKAQQRGTNTGKYGTGEIEPFKPDPVSTHWIEIELVDEAGAPVPGERYKVTFADDTVSEGILDHKGFVRVEGITEGGQAKITFPNLDKEAWEKKGGGGSAASGEKPEGRDDSDKKSEEAKKEVEVVEGGADEPNPGGITDDAPEPAAPPKQKEEKSEEEKKKLSGKHWVEWRNKNAPNTKSLDDLISPFKENVKEFIKAMEDAGMSVSVTNTLRSTKSAYLFHWCWKIGLGKAKAKDAAKMDGVDIEWDHGDDEKSKAGAKEMIDGFGLAVPPKSEYPPALSSRHTEGRAVDMDITWTKDVKIKKKDGTEVDIKGTPRTGAANTVLHQVGASYNVKKLIGDDPHWSDDGK